MMNSLQNIVNVNDVDTAKIRSILEQSNINTKSINAESEIFVYTEYDLLKCFKFRLNYLKDYWVNIRVDDNRVSLCDEIKLPKTKISFERLVLFVNTLNDKYSTTKIYVGDLKEFNSFMIFISYDILFFENLSIPDFILQIKHFMHMHQVVTNEMMDFLY